MGNGNKFINCQDVTCIGNGNVYKKSLAQPPSTINVISAKMNKQPYFTVGRVLFILLFIMGYVFYSSFNDVNQAMNQRYKSSLTMNDNGTFKENLQCFRIGNNMKFSNSENCTITGNNNKVINSKQVKLVGNNNVMEE